MRLIPLATVASMDEGELVTYTRGRVTKMDKRIEGTKTDGSGETYSFQKMTITDGQISVMVKVWDRDPLPANWVGHEIHIFSQTGANNRLGGLKIKKENYRGRTSTYVNCTPSAGMDFSVPAGATEEQPAPQSHPAPVSHPQPAPAPAPRQTQPAMPQPPARQPAAPAAPSGPTQQQKWQPLGPTIGMAVNNACASLIASGEPLTTQRIFEVSSDILRATKWLEDGKIAPKLEDRMKKAATEPGAEAQAEG